MIIAFFLIAFGFAAYADRIDDQERCEAQVRLEAPQEPTRADYRRQCPMRN